VLTVGLREQTERIHRRVRSSSRDYLFPHNTAGRNGAQLEPRRASMEVQLPGASSPALDGQLVGDWFVAGVSMHEVTEGVSGPRADPTPS
jgi:hypothetical protein